jgi:hypothetical protein
MLAAACVSALALGACASAPPPQPEYPRQLSPSEEADLIAAAKRHPIATTYDRPRGEGDLPVAPPKIPPEPPAPPRPAEAQVPAAPRDQVVIVGNEPAPPTAYQWPETSYPTYGADPYVWVDGAWVARPSWRAYAGTPWVGVGVGVGRPYGWGWGYNYGWGYRPRAWVAPPPVFHGPTIVTPYRPRARYHDHAPPARSWGYQSSPRRQVYVAPRAPSGPVYRAPPAARPRSSAPVYRAPAATPHGSSGGRRSVRVR